MQPTRLDKQRSFVISVTVPLFAAPSGPQLQLWNTSKICMLFFWMSPQHSIRAVADPPVQSCLWSTLCLLCTKGHGGFVHCMTGLVTGDAQEPGYIVTAKAQLKPLQECLKNGKCLPIPKKCLIKTSLLTSGPLKLCFLSIPVNDTSHQRTPMSKSCAWLSTTSSTTAVGCRQADGGTWCNHQMSIETC